VEKALSQPEMLLKNWEAFERKYLEVISK